MAILLQPVCFCFSCLMAIHHDFHKLKAQSHMRLGSAKTTYDLKTGDHQQPPAITTRQIDSSHIYFVTGDYCRTSCTTGGWPSYKICTIIQDRWRVIMWWLAIVLELRASVCNICTNTVTNQGFIYDWPRVAKSIVQYSYEHSRILKDY